jgi:hypothetical protein
MNDDGQGVEDGSPDGGEEQVKVAAKKRRRMS